MTGREPRVLGSRVPERSLTRDMLRLDPAAIRLIDRAAARQGLKRSDFLRKAIDAAVQSTTGEHLPPGIAD